MSSKFEGISSKTDKMGAIQKVLLFKIYVEKMDRKIGRRGMRVEYQSCQTRNRLSIEHVINSGIIIIII